jgi:flagellar motility protein MotE (MotC chaperone)
MAKAGKKEKSDKSFTRFQWILFTVVIPILFAVVITLVVMTVAGINVFEKAKAIGSNIPFVEKVIPTEEKESIERLESKVVSLQAEIEDKEAKISQLQGKIDSQENDQEQLQAEKQQLQDQIEELMQIQKENKRAFKEVVSTFETMSAKSAAPVILEMEDSEAIKILSNVKPETLAKILEKMPPADAATYTGLLSTSSDSE